jgi:dethiobiotin synthetase
VKYVVVTGTGTGVGKTWLGCALANELASGGKRVVAIKPVETGVRDGVGDGELLAASTGQAAPKRALVRLRDPLTPALAAEREGVALDFDELVANVVKAAEGYDHALVEGAGGVLSPITYDADATTLVHRLGASTAVVLVASDALGTLSAVHTAVQCLMDWWILPSAIVLVEPAERDASTGTNAAVLRRRLANCGDCASRIFEVARGDTASIASIARALRPAV